MGPARVGGPEDTSGAGCFLALRAGCQRAGPALFWTVPGGLVLGSLCTISAQVERVAQEEECCVWLRAL